MCAWRFASNKNAEQCRAHQIFILVTHSENAAMISLTLGRLAEATFTNLSTSALRGMA